jgi:prevent-host-death family protein
MNPKSATAGNPGEVGVRELRDNLSRHLKTVKAGGELTVTDHGKPVARLVPWDGMSKFEKLVAEGRITPARRPKEPLPPPLKIEGGLSHLIKEQRG